MTYDAAGNLTTDGTGTGTHTYQWDAENRMSSIDTGTTSNYTYNALGQRVEKKVGSTYTEFMFDGSGEPVGERNRTSWSVSAVSFGGRHLAHYQSSATYFMHGNKLGSTSQATDYSGAMSQDQLYCPWGQDWAMVGSSQEKRFASLQHRDTTETGLDPTQFRMFSSTKGRWFSTDPLGGNVAAPQSLNRYAYVLNNPSMLTDRLGLLNGPPGPPAPPPYSPPSVGAEPFPSFCTITTDMWGNISGVVCNDPFASPVSGPPPQGSPNPGGTSAGTPTSTAPALPSCFEVFFNAAVDFLSPTGALVSTAVSGVQPVAQGVDFAAYSTSIAANAAKYGFEIGSASRISLATSAAQLWRVGQFAQTVSEVSLPATLIIAELVGLNAEINAVNQGTCR